MSLLRQLLVFLVVVSMMPGITDLAENFSSMFADPDPVHIVDHDDQHAHPALEAEHGCIPTNHVCSCHISIPAVLADATVVTPPGFGLALQARHPTDVWRLLSRANAPPVPPPLA